MPATVQSALQTKAMGPFTPLWANGIMSTFYSIHVVVATSSTMKCSMDMSLQLSGLQRMAHLKTLFHTTWNSFTLRCLCGPNGSC